MEKPDWDSINRMVHIQLGKLRWENSERHRKRKRKFDSFAEEASTMSEMEDTVDSVVLGDNLLPVDWDKELMERLRPAKKRANHKRAASQNDLELTFTQHQFTNIAYNGQQEPHREQRAQSEDPSIEACARQRRRRYQNNRAHLIVEHDESEMSRRSPGDRKRRQTSSKGDVVDLSNDSKPPLALPEEGEDFEDSLVGLSALDRARLSSKYSASPAPASISLTINLRNQKASLESYLRGEYRLILAEISRKSAVHQNCHILRSQYLREMLAR
jgi:hypothetical protein